MKKATVVLVILLLAGILFERVSARREEAHRRQGQIELVRVKKVCGYAAQSRVGDPVTSYQKQDIAEMRAVAIQLNASCAQEITDWTHSYPGLAAEQKMAGESLKIPVGLMPGRKTLCIIDVDQGCTEKLASLRDSQ